MQVRCRLCRCVLVEDETQVAEHPGREQQRRPREFIRKDGQAGSSRLGVAPRGCTHLFVTEQAWMEPVIRGEEVTEGSLSCPNCTGKVGTFSWIGIRCSCGEWVVPGFALLKSKIDILKDSTR